MPATYNVETDLGKVRLIISDVGGSDSSSFLFQDNEIEAFLSMANGSIRMAAAAALRSIAGNEAQVSKRITFLDLKTDGPAVADSLRKLAEDLEKNENEGGEFDFAQMGVDVFSRRILREEFAFQNEV